MNDVLMTPDASPDCSGSTSLIAASSTGLNAMPAPTPIRIMLGSTFTRYVASVGANARSRIPAPASPRPVASGARNP